jgi:hypothetical protein
MLSIDDRPLFKIDMTILILLIVSSLSDCTQQVFTGGDVVLIDETFDSCSSSTNGGAVFISAWSGTIVGCAFLICSTVGDGGGLYLLANEILVSRCSFVTCHAGLNAASAWVDATGAVPVNWTETTSIGATCERNTFVFSGSSSESYWPRFAYGNVTSSHTVAWGSGLECETYRLIFEFCEIESNQGQNCILFYFQTLPRIRCLAVRSNICSGSDFFVGLFYAQAAFTIEDSVITGNTVNYLVDSPSTATFRNCHPRRMQSRGELF